MSVVGPVRAAAIQMNSGADVQQNLQTIDGLLEDATSRGVAIAFLPENLAIMGVRDEDKLQHAENPGSGPIQEFLADRGKASQALGSRRQLAIKIGAGRQMLRCIDCLR